MSAQHQPIINQTSPVSIGLAALFCAGVFSAGVMYAKVQTIDNMKDVPVQIALMRADIRTIQHRLGIPGDDRQALGSSTSSAQAAIEPLQSLQRSTPRRALVLPE